MAAGTGGEGLFAALKTLLVTLVGIGRTRLELLSTELQEEKLRLVSLLVYAIAALFFFAIGIVVAVGWLVAAFWEQRIIVLAVSALLFLLLGAILVSRAAAVAQRNSSLFRSSLAELDTDLARLKGEAGKQP